MTVGALPITMAPAAGGKSVATEFGWATPFSCATKTPRDTVPTSGFNLSTFVGKSNGGIVPSGSFTAWDVTGDGVPGSNARGGVNFLADGTVTGTYLGGFKTAGSSNWYSPTTPAIGSSYWIRFTVTAGTSTTNTASTWTQLSATRNITKSGLTGTGFCAFTVEIATDSAGSNIVFTKTLNNLNYQHTMI
jgi:hypothetical protein